MVISKMKDNNSNRHNEDYEYWIDAVQDGAGERGSRGARDTYRLIPVQLRIFLSCAYAVEKLNRSATVMEIMTAHEELFGFPVMDDPAVARSNIYVTNQTLRKGGWLSLDWPRRHYPTKKGWLVVEALYWE